MARPWVGSCCIGDWGWCLRLGGVKVSPRFVSAELLFQSQNAAIELAHKLGLAEARIAELQGKVPRPEFAIYMPRQPGKSTMNSMHVINELAKMVQQLTRPADPEGRGWQHPSLAYVEECRNRIKGMI